MRLISNEELFCVGGGSTLLAVAGPAILVPAASANQDYCSNVPDSPFGFEFGGDCRSHDINYGTDTPYTRSQADSIFLSDMIATCNEKYDGSLLCKATAVTYYLGVRVFGSSHYEGSK